MYAFQSREIELGDNVECIRALLEKLNRQGQAPGEAALGLEL